MCQYVIHIIMTGHGIWIICRNIFILLISSDEFGLFKAHIDRTRLNFIGAIKQNELNLLKLL